MADQNPQVLLALEVWIAAAWADGVISEAEEAGMTAVINIAKLSDEERKTALGWLKTKVSLDDINVSQIPPPERVNIFAAALGVVAMDEEVVGAEKAFLERLQIALQIDDKTAASIRKTAAAGMAAHMPHMPPPAGGPSHGSAIAAAASTYDAAAVEDKGHVVTSPFVGTFYRKPNPDSSDYCKLGDKVKKGAVLCIVEAMKLMNEIEADIEGTITGILAEDGAPVEYGQALFKITP